MSMEDIIQQLDLDQSRACYPERIKSLTERGRNPIPIEKGIEDTLRVLEAKTRSFVIYGEPQSGKTEFMIALVCKLIDLNYKTIFVVMNDNTELENQNFDRFHAAPELNPTPCRDFEIPGMPEVELKVDKQRIIFCRKNSKNLQKMIHHCRFMKDRVVIDDEADFATPNSKINKAEVTAINEHLGDLGHLDSSQTGVYIGVTATPARLDLNNTYLNDSTKWVFLKSHEQYKGRMFFFPITAEEARISNSNYQLVKMPDDQDNPKFLRESVYRFLLRVAALNLPGGSERTAYSMLIHTAGKTNDHEKDQQDVQRILGVLQNREDVKFNSYGEALLNQANDLKRIHNLSYTANQLVIFVLQNIGKSEVLVINHKNDSANVRRAGQPKSLFTFAIGGNIVSRGLTFENLLTFFFSRNVKGKLQQNTYIQRARMFGNRPYSKYFELCVPGSLFEDWATCFNDHALSLRFAEAGTYMHVHSKRTQIVDKGAIDLENVTVQNNERAVGIVFPLTEELRNAFLQKDIFKPLTLIKQLIKDGLLTQDCFPLPLIQYLEEVSKRDESDIYIVRRFEENAPVLQNIERYKSDGDPDTMTRKRGGIIHAMLNKRTEYDSHSHFILPIRNDKGEARLLYKATIGHAIYQNLMTHKPT
ncbi:Z1 domain-containing protein [bacterium]|nr:Z1 domain-containing protein [bacterium]